MSSRRTGAVPGPKERFGRRKEPWNFECWNMPILWRWLQRLQRLQVGWQKILNSWNRGERRLWKIQGSHATALAEKRNRHLPFFSGFFLEVFQIFVCKVPNKSAMAVFFGSMHSCKLQLLGGVQLQLPRLAPLQEGCQVDCFVFGVAERHRQMAPSAEGAAQPLPLQRLRARRLAAAVAVALQY